MSKPRSRSKAAQPAALSDADIWALNEVTKQDARDHLLAACAFLDPNYRANFHHEVIAEAFERFARGTLKRGIICAPPGTGKSDLVSRKGPAWAIGNDPSLYFGMASYSADLAGDMAEDCYNICVSSAYRELFPEVGVGTTMLEEDDGAPGAKVKKQGKHWRTSKKGGYKAFGRGGGITGKHPQRIIVDDPLKGAEEADSPTIRDKTWDWFNKEVLLRLGAHGGCLVMLTRWHKDDIVGRIKKLMKDDPEAEQWEIIELPARLDTLEGKHAKDPRKLGQSLWPWMYSGGQPGGITPNPLPANHPDSLTLEEQEVRAQAFLRRWEKQDTPGFISLGQQRPAAKSAYGAHAYHNHGPKNWIPSYIPVRNRPILVCMDFNYDPMGSVLCQKTVIGGREAVVAFRANAFRNCDTTSACERIIDQVGEDFNYIIYPDPACQARTAHGKGGESDLELIENAFRKIKGKFWVRVKPAHPKRKDRLNAVNAALGKHAQPARAADPATGMPAMAAKEQEPILLYLVKDDCTPLVTDFDECGMEEFLNGKFNDDALGHVSDGLGYMIDYEFPATNEFVWHTKM